MVTYVEMICDLDQATIGSTTLPDGITIHPIYSVSADALYACYQAAFAAGDAQFYFQQNEAERRAFFDTLGLEAAANDPASVVLKQNDQIIGFALVLPYGQPTNHHISCMCIHPAQQGRGLGKQLLWIVMQRVKDSGGKTITLGTEPTMRAYHLYQTNGFIVST